MLKPTLLLLLLTSATASFAQSVKPQGAFISTIKSCTVAGTEYTKGDSIGNDRIRELRRYDSGVYALTDNGGYVLLRDNAGYMSDNDASAKDRCLTSKTGYEICAGQAVRIGIGSLPSGDFKYIRVNSASMFRMVNTDGSQRGVNEANALPSSSSGHSYEVKRVENRGSNKHGFVQYAVFTLGAVRYEVDIDNAIASGELDVPDAYKAARQAGGGVQQSSPADEIMKYKKLLDAGAITQEEYNKKKAELLSK